MGAASWELTDQPRDSGCTEDGSAACTSCCCACWGRLPALMLGLRLTSADMAGGVDAVALGESPAWASMLCQPDWLVARRSSWSSLLLSCWAGAKLGSPLRMEDAWLWLCLQDSAGSVYVLVLRMTEGCAMDVWLALRFCQA